jgi:fructose-1,6-bisphosphatase
MNVTEIIRAYEELKFYVDEKYTREEAREEMDWRLEYITEEELNELLNLYYFNIEEVDHA